MEFDDPRNEEQAKQAIKGKKLLKKFEYENKNKNNLHNL
jgi:hypothetical protein